MFFQNSVLNKHLKTQNENAIQAAYDKYVAYFHDSVRQQNIRESKEEQFQEGFLRELFVKILGYTLNPEPDFNLTTELKNEKGAKKTDGAILHPDRSSGVKALGVIELKGTDTKDLDKVNEQAFNYKNNHKACVYVITSNFEKLRFFIHNAVEHIEFNLFTLTAEEFKVLWLCLQADNLLSGLPLKVKEESLLAEENITKQLYKDYSAFRTDLWQNMAKNHPKDDQLMLFKKTQKLLDRFLFIFFAEDSGLLPPNSISKIIEKWKQDTEWGEVRSLYEIFKQYFGFINSGRPAKGSRSEIFGYNGGLFKEDLILDNITIDDDVLLKHTEKLTAYDFQSEVDVNILGHIFENSLTEFENITAELEGQELDKSKTKRKKDGVFYTPKYITKYIVDNTIGKLCEEKKAELNISDERFGQASKRSQKGIKDLKAYRDWLLDLKICDPACGSGAFLNQALEFLMEEHRYLDELTAQYHKSPLVLSDIEKHILEQNIYGVDINEESVEIAKLSLWLRTAQRGRKLTSLNNNIKCGNSLIDDPKVAGEKAFNWQKEFPKVFAKGGFDVVIGNPPYGAELSIIEKNWFKEKFKITQGIFDTYLFFFEKTYSLLKSNGLTGVITPNTFLVIENGSILRKFLYEKMQVIALLEVFNVFPDAVVEPIVSIFRKEVNDTYKFIVKLIDRNTKLSSDIEFSAEPSIYNKTVLFEQDNLIFNYRLKNKEKKLLDRVMRSSSRMGEVLLIKAGVKPYEKGKGTPPQTADVVKSKPFNKYEKVDDDWKKVIRGTDINRYQTKWTGEYIKYGEWLAAPRSAELFSSPKIFMRRTDDSLMSDFDNTGKIGINSVHCIQLIQNNNDNELKIILAQLNSRLLNWVFEVQNFHMVGKPLAEVKVVFVERLPFKDSSNREKEEFVQLVNTIIDIKKNLNQNSSNFLSLLNSKFSIEKLSRKLQNWHELEFSDFLKELKKAKVQLSLSEEAEWMQYFGEQKNKAQELKAEIDRVDGEIDRMVYKLYGLTEEEIAIVENSIK